MIPDTAMITLADRLRDKTARQEIKWLAVETADESTRTSYQFTEREVQVRIALFASYAEPDHYMLPIFIDGKQTGNLTAYPDEGESFELLRDLHNRAEATALKGDKTFAKLHELLSSDRVLGESATVGVQG